MASSQAAAITKQQSSQASVFNPANLPIPIGKPSFLPTKLLLSSLFPPCSCVFQRSSKQWTTAVHDCVLNCCESICKCESTMDQFSQTAAPGTCSSGSFFCRPLATRLLLLLLIAAHLFALVSGAGGIQTEPDLDSVDARAEKPQAADLLMPNGKQERLAHTGQAYRPASWTRRSRFLSASAPSGIARAVPSVHESFRRVPATCNTVPDLCGSSFYRQAGATSCCSGQCCDIRSHNSHCGRCGNKCGLGSACCNGKCVQLKKDVHNCGRCGNKCHGKHPVCSYGMCNYNGRHW